MVINNVTKFHKILIKIFELERGHRFKLEEEFMVLNNVSKFHKVLIKTNQFSERTSFKTVNFHKQRAITSESLVRYGLLSNLKNTL